ncbi:MAG: hypothetical protein IJ189_14100 [Clostridia bacterium]|nr:hypothetical protein [Clostridia bacterium]
MRKKYSFIITLIALGLAAHIFVSPNPPKDRQYARTAAYSAPVAASTRFVRTSLTTAAPEKTDIPLAAAEQTATQKPAADAAPATRSLPKAEAPATQSAVADQTEKPVSVTAQEGKNAPEVKASAAKNAASSSKQATADSATKKKASATAAPAKKTPTTAPTKKPAAIKTYILNTNTKKFHLQSCRSVRQMKNKNKKTYTGTRQQVINMGYVPCKNCSP